MNHDIQWYPTYCINICTFELYDLKIIFFGKKTHGQAT